MMQSLALITAYFKYYILYFFFCKPKCLYLILQAWVVERFGKFNRILEPGLNFLIPVVDRIKYVQSLKEIAIDIPSQSAITSGN